MILRVSNFTVDTGCMFKDSVWWIVAQTKLSVKCWSCYLHLLHVLLGISCGQSNDTACPTLKEVHSSQEALASQLRDVLAKYKRQQSSESLTNLMQLMVIKQLMAEIDLNTPTVRESTTSGDQSKGKPTNATIAGSDLTGVLEAMNATINLMVVKDMENKQAIHNLTAILTSSILENRQAIHNLTQVVQGFRPYQSCNETKSAQPGSTSGNYNILGSNGTLSQVYCHMEEVCGSSGWMRVAHLNMTDPSEQCPSGFRLYSESGVRACGSPTLAKGCQASVRFATHAIPFSEVCGRVTGYQYWSPDAFNVGSLFVDGVSLTYGSSHKHIWSFAAARLESDTSCPCAHSANISTIGNDYFCESGYSGPSVQRRLYPEPLWDGQGCRSSETPCCNATGIPWFHKRLSAATTNFIELRICSDASDEDTPVGYYDIFVK